MVLCKPPVSESFWGGSNLVYAQKLTTKHNTVQKTDRPKAQVLRRGPNSKRLGWEAVGLSPLLRSATVAQKQRTKYEHVNAAVSQPNQLQKQAAAAGGQFADF